MHNTNNEKKRNAVEVNKRVSLRFFLSNCCFFFPSDDDDDDETAKRGSGGEQRERQEDFPGRPRGLSHLSHPMNARVGKKFRLGHKIGSGSFGDVYWGTNMTTGEEVAIKLEPMGTAHPQLMREAQIYRDLMGGGTTSRSLLPRLECLLADLFLFAASVFWIF